MASAEQAKMKEARALCYCRGKLKPFQLGSREWICHSCFDTNKDTKDTTFYVCASFRSCKYTTIARSNYMICTECFTARQPEEADQKGDDELDDDAFVYKKLQSVLLRIDHRITQCEDEGTDDVAMRWWIYRVNRLCFKSWISRCM